MGMMVRGRLISGAHQVCDALVCLPAPHDTLREECFAQSFNIDGSNLQHLIDLVDDLYLNASITQITTCV
jgi:hypothetical protein